MTTLLIVDDEHEIRENLIEFFELKQFKTYSAANGFEALEFLEHQSIDIVIIDLFMPVKDGLETITELRKGWPDVKIIAMSGGPARLTHNNLGDDLLYAATEIGADASLQKPFSLIEAGDTVKNLLAA
tara:strand:- start:1156 stop:1539 length:384 start_codon:yes stop_codon:yes gene_type:complete